MWKTFLSFSLLFSQITKSSKISKLKQNNLKYFPLISQFLMFITKPNFSYHNYCTKQPFYFMRTMLAANEIIHSTRIFQSNNTITDFCNSP